MTFLPDFVSALRYWVAFTYLGHHYWVALFKMSQILTKSFCIHILAACPSPSAVASFQNPGEILSLQLCPSPNLDEAPQNNNWKVVVSSAEPLGIERLFQITLSRMQLCEFLF